MSLVPPGLIGETAARFSPAGVPIISTAAMTSSADDGKRKAKPGKAGREERLAAKLRQNLVRRKVQRRGRDEPDPTATGEDNAEEPEKNRSS